jgi:hypothetical protein
LPTLVLVAWVDTVAAVVVGVELVEVEVDLDDSKVESVLAWFGVEKASLRTSGPVNCCTTTLGRR